VANCSVISVEVWSIIQGLGILYVIRKARIYADHFRPSVRHSVRISVCESVPIRNQSVCWIFIKFSVGVLRKVDQVWISENRRSESQALRRSFNKFISVLPTYINSIWVKFGVDCLHTIALGIC
jgi:hypothetical protein